MDLLDANILIYAFRDDTAPHAAVAAYLNELASGERAFGVPELCLSALVRVVTQKPWMPPSATPKVLQFCAALRSSPQCMVVQPSERHWHVFDQLCRMSGASGKLVADAYLAAYAVDRDDEWVTFDSDFRHFPGLRWRNPIVGQSRTNPR